MSTTLAVILERENELFRSRIEEDGKRIKKNQKRIAELTTPTQYDTIQYDPMMIVVPAEVDQAARVVEDWFWHQGHKKWAYKGIQSRDIRPDPSILPTCIYWKR